MEEFLAENKLFNYADLQQLGSHSGAYCFKLTVPIVAPSPQVPDSMEYTLKTPTRKIISHSAPAGNKNLCVHFHAPLRNSSEISIRVHEPVAAGRNHTGSQVWGVHGTKLRLQISVCPSQNDPYNYYGGTNAGQTQRGFLVNAEPIEGDANKIRSECTNEYNHCIGQGGKFLEAKNVKFPADILYDVLTRTSYPNRCLNGIISVILLKPKPVDIRPVIPQPKHDQMSITKTILSEKIQSDMSIVTSNGSAVKCHKNFLAAHSTVLTAMFESKLKESKTGEIHMPDVSEAGVNAFLAYLYTWDLTEPDKLSSIALELLEAGHKYNVYSLEEKMKNLFLLKGNDWYDVEIALKLFLFARNIEGYDDLKTRAVQVMKLNPKGMMQSKLFKKIFKKDSEAALELCGFAFLCLQ